MKNVKSKFILPKLFFPVILFGVWYPVSALAATSFSLAPTTARVQGGNTVTLAVQVPEPRGEVPGAENSDLERLFDVRLLIHEPVVSNIRDLVGTVSFESFGTVATPVEMEFIILDASGAAVWTSSGSTIVKSEQVFNQRFPDLGELPEGMYTLRLRTLYDTDVEDFFEAPFEIRNGAPLAHAWTLWFLGCCGLLLCGISLWWFFVFGRRRCCNCDANDKQCPHDCCKGDVTEPDRAKRIEQCKRCRRVAMYGRVAFAFSIALLAIQIIVMAWSKLVTGMWTNLSFLNDMPNILIASFAIASIYAVARYMKYARARSFILPGLSLVALEVFLEVIVKKYVIIRGFSRAADWFFLFGAVEFIGIVFVLVGMVAFLDLIKKKKNI